jgi:hypothetical protein
VVTEAAAAAADARFLGEKCCMPAYRTDRNRKGYVMEGQDAIKIKKHGAGAGRI